METLIIGRPDQQKLEVQSKVQVEASPAVRVLRASLDSANDDDRLEVLYIISQAAAE